MNNFGYFLLSIILVLYSVVDAQRKEYREIDRKMKDIPVEQVQSIQGISSYINDNWELPDHRIRAIYSWIVENISYEYSNRFYLNEKKSGIVQQTLERKTGVCENYAHLFKILALQCGIRSYLVTGQSKQRGVVGTEPHMWCAVRIDSSWYLYDPTWGAGQVIDDKYVKRRNDNYFKMKPSKAIRSHFPFDPLFQFLYYPINHSEFLESIQPKIDPSRFFYYQDSLQVYDSQTPIQRLEGEKRRMEADVIDSYLFYIKYEQLGFQINSYYSERVLKYYDSANDLCQEAMREINEIIQYKNQKFEPSKGDEFLVEKLNRIKDGLLEAERILRQIDKGNKRIHDMIENLSGQIELANSLLFDQMEFVERYLHTSHELRRTLFYGY